MKQMMTAPKVDNYIRTLSSNTSLGYNFPFDYDGKSYENIDTLFELLQQISPVNERGDRILWFPVMRGDIADFGSYEEFLEDGEVNSLEEFKALWSGYYPESEKWYKIVAIDDKEINYRAIFLNLKFVIEVDGRKQQKRTPYDISEFTGWLVSAVGQCITELRAGTYNRMVNERLPSWCRVGTIKRKDFWTVFPKLKEDFFASITEEEVSEFIRLARKQAHTMQEFTQRRQTMAAADFLSFCAMGYAANGYAGCDKSPAEQYRLHADGRDDGLLSLDLDSESAFAYWLDSSHGIGHPWEVCRGGNSTHISLMCEKDDNGYWLILAGSSECRTIETIKFYLALCKAGVPVYLHHAAALISRLEETELIGIVPRDVIPVYCSQYFPNEDIIDFMNYPYECTEQVEQFCTWQPLDEITLI